MPLFGLGVGLDRFQVVKYADAIALVRILAWFDDPHFVHTLLEVPAELCVLVLRVHVAYVEGERQERVLHVQLVLQLLVLEVGMEACFGTDLLIVLHMALERVLVLKLAW